MNNFYVHKNAKIFNVKIFGIRVVKNNRNILKSSSREISSSSCEKVRMQRHFVQHALASEKTDSLFFTRHKVLCSSRESYNEIAENCSLLMVPSS